MDGQLTCSLSVNLIILYCCHSVFSLPKLLGTDNRWTQVVLLRVMAKWGLMTHFLYFLTPLDGALGLKKKAQGMAIHCTFNPLLNRQRHLVGSLLAITTYHSKSFPLCAHLNKQCHKLYTACQVQQLFVWIYIPPSHMHWHCHDITKHPAPSILWGCVDERCCHFLVWQGLNSVKEYWVTFLINN